MAELNRGDLPSLFRNPTLPIDVEPPAPPAPAATTTTDEFRPAELMPSGAKAKARTNVEILHLLGTLRSEGRKATDAEKQTLARWSGWGALPGVFDDANSDFADVRAEARSLLSDETWAAARKTTVNAHYTPAHVVNAMWTAAMNLGFEGGRVLEPGCGAGGFIGLAPDLVMRIVGVELDPTTADVARYLYPHADIRAEGFQDTKFPPGYFDLAIGNVPFGSYVVHDPAHNPNRHTIHNHFIVKSLRLTRPGGLVALVTSRYTLDALDTAARRDMAELADLVGAVRLPSGAMKQAGSDVVVDVLVFRRTETPAPDPKWMSVLMLATDEGPVHINEWYVDHPELVLGELTSGRGMYGRDELIVESDGRDLVVALDEGFASFAPPLPGHPVRPTEAEVVEAEALALFEAPDVEAEPIIDVPDTVDDLLDDVQVWEPEPEPAEPEEVEPLDIGAYRDGSIVAFGKGFVRVQDGITVPFTPTPAKDAAELRLLLGLRDTVMVLLDRQLRDDAWLGVQAELNRLYDAYVMQFGPLNRYSKARTGRVDEKDEDIMRIMRPRMGGFAVDPAYRTVLALEVFDPEEQTARKAAIFSKQVVGPRVSHDKAESPADALALCLDEVGRVDLARIAELLDCTPEEALAGLGKLVWDDPRAGLVTAAEYLSGNVRIKLAQAEQAARRDERYMENVQALRDVMPDDLGPGEIDARLGAPWLETDDIRNFIIEVLEVDQWALRDLIVEHAEVTATWEVQFSSYNRHGVAFRSRWGTPRADAIDNIKASLNQRPITVYDTVQGANGNDVKVVNHDETMLAREKQDALATRFREWVWEDKERSDRIVQVYNERFNSHVVPTYDGSHIRAHGLSLAFKPHPQQLNGAWRIMQEPSCLLAHPVGAGKTGTMAIAAMEMRRLGLVKKPAIVVPNHMLDQFTSEFLQLYPLADVLVPTKDDMTAGGRKGFVARCAMSDADVVILTHSQFERVPVSPATHRAFIQRKIDAYEEAIEASKGEKGLSVKKLEAAKMRMEEKMQRLLDAQAKDDGVNFEQTGIDYLFVDEAQAFKNLAFPTKMQSVGGAGSKRASDLEIKLAYLRAQYDRFASFATATPIANSIAEMFTVQSYLQPDLLEEAGVASFDAWAATFGSTVTALELAPDGGSYRMHSRFARFHNVPELTTMFRLVADVRTKEELALPVPNVEGGQAEIVVVDPTPELKEYVETLVKRAEDIRNRRVRPEEDNMLVVCGDGRRAALDLRLVHMPEGKRAKGGKLDVVADRIAAEWRRHRHRTYLESDGTPSPRPGGFQRVFCDLSTPRQEWNAYDELRTLLVERGMDAGRIRFIHEARDARQKEEMFASCRAGRVDVLVGSTGKMGVGTNVQTRLTALHHIDCPWRPDEIEQREGRGLRQGNQNDEVAILRYATEGSFDVYMWQTVERKAKFIFQVMSGQITAREIDDVGDAALSYAEIKALATGNPLIMEKAGVDMEVARLGRLRRAHATDQTRMKDRMMYADERLPKLRERLAWIEAAIDRRLPFEDDAFSMTVGDETFTERQAAAFALADALGGVFNMGATGEKHTVGSFAGFPMQASVFRYQLDSELTLEFVDAPGDISMKRSDLRKDPRRGLLVRVENMAADMEKALVATARSIESVEADREAATLRLGDVFPQEERLNELLARQRVIDEELAALEKRDDAPVPA